jgi:hypothetical protein
MTRALGGEDAGQPVDRLAQAVAPLEVGRLARQAGKQMPQPPARHGEEAAVRGDAHDDLGDRQRDHLGVIEFPAGVRRPAGQEIVGGDINRGAEGVEVGVHRGLQVDGAIATVDFDPSASNPGTTEISVESII